jgi:type IVB pilus formation R64 PilN family outer membrane protein
MWAQFEKSIEAMISDGAKLTVSPSDGTITLTATPNDIKLVAKYINEQNARLSRQVAISAKIMQVTISDSDNYGLDLKASFGDGVSSFGITGTQGLSSEDTSSSLTWGILKKNWSADAIVQAISEKNRATLVTSGTVTTLNNKPAPIQVTQKQNYISEMTKTNNGTDGSNYDISVTTEEVETGFTLDVLPRILEHGRLLLMFNMTLSDLLALEKVSFGNADENQYIQNPKIESRAFTQEVAMASGESLILTGYEKVSSSTDKTGTGSAENSLLGGQAAAEKERNILVIVLTPVVLETPLSPEARMSMN